MENQTDMVGNGQGKVIEVSGSVKVQSTCRASCTLPVRKTPRVKPHREASPVPRTRIIRERCSRERKSPVRSVAKTGGDDNGGGDSSGESNSDSDPAAARRTADVACIRELTGEKFSNLEKSYWKNALSERAASGKIPPKRLTQQEVHVLMKLQNGERLSQPSMIGEGCWRLASRVSAIRKHGWNVQSVILPGGFKEYFIDPESPRIAEEDEQQMLLPLGDLP